MVFVVSFILYLCLVISVAIAAYFFTKNLSDFVLGGRRLNGPVAALSSGASDMSAWLLLGLPGAAYMLGFSQIWLPIGLTIGAYFNWRLLARPLRLYTELANDSLTIPAFLENRLSDKSHRIRVISALATVSFFAVYTASGLVGGAMLIERSFGFDYEVSLLCGTSIILGYTMVGGFLAVSWTDFFQGIFMFLCLLVVPILGVIHLGGLEQTIVHINHINPNYFTITSGMSLFGVFNLLAWGLGYFGQPHILVRFMAIRSLADIPLARRIAIAWMFLAMTGALLTGIVGVAYFDGRIDNPESVFINFSYELFSPALSGIILAAILSSIMCAIDSQMLASTSALSEDLYHPLFRPKATQKELVWVSRIGLMLIAAVAVSISWYSQSGVLDLVSFAWAGLASTFAAPVVLSLFWRHITANGAFFGMLVGGVVSVIWFFKTGGIFDVYEIIPGISASFISVIIASRLGEAPNRAQLELFDEVHRQLKQK